MVGRWIDRGALTVVGTVSMYALFMNAGAGIVPSCVLAFVCAVLMRYIWRHRPGRGRITAARAEASLLDIVLRGDAAAIRALSQREDVKVVLRHPDGRLTLNEAFELWRDAGDGAAIAVTCDPEDAAAGFMRSRGMALIDRKCLTKRIRQTGRFLVDEPPREPLSGRVTRAWGNVRVGPRALICGASLMAAYLATGRGICLVCALFVMGAAGAKLIERYV